MRTGVLFVCSGNICRSAMAEVIGRSISRYTDVEFSSAGTIAITDTQATLLARQVVGELGLDLSKHKARRLTDVAAPDLVFGMEQEHLVAARDAFPDLPPGTIRLLDHPSAISDPYGHDLSVYRVTAETISRALSAISLP